MQKLAVVFAKIMEGTTQHAIQKAEVAAKETLEHNAIIFAPQSILWPAALQPKHANAMQLVQLLLVTAMAIAQTTA